MVKGKSIVLHSRIRSNNLARALASTTAFLIVLLLGAPAYAQQAVTIQLAPMNGSTVSGTVTLTANGDATEAVLDLTGLEPGASGNATLYANTCELPSASFAPVVEFTADAGGSAHATGRIRFRLENVSLDTIADNLHVIGITSGGQLVACGTVPALTTSSPNLPATGGAMNSALYPVFAVVGLFLFLAGMLAYKKSSGG